MKRLFITLLLISTLAVSAMAFNAPLTAAQFNSGASLEHATNDDLLANGTLQIVEKPSVLLQNADEQGNVYYLDGRALKPITIPSDAFDIVAGYVTGKEPTAMAGCVLSLFFNPEIIEYVLTRNFNSYAGLYDSDSQKITVTDALFASILQTEPQGNFAQNLMDAYENASKDGVVSIAAASGADFTFLDLSGKELARWTLAQTNPDNNNWYRTKISLDFAYDGIADVNGNYYSPVVEAPVYYYNTNYDGPAFDIVGGMKKGEGELRFGSVYFIGEDEYFDNRAEIVEAGVVCYPSALLEDKVLTLETKGAVRIPATGYYTKDEKQMVYTGVLTGLPKDMYITAKSYIIYKDKETGTEVTVYSDPIARNLKTADTENMK